MKRMPVLVILSVLAIVLASCAQKAGTGASSGAGGSTLMASGSGSGLEAPGSGPEGSGSWAGADASRSRIGGSITDGSPTALPDPREFASLGELTPVHFDFDKYDIRPGDAKILDANARWMKANPNYLILIEGHADERGTNEYNLALGERRATATMSYLVAQGVHARRLTLMSYGEERPLCAEKTEDCWAQNRRGDFRVKLQ